MKKVLRVLSLFVMVGALASLTSCKKDNADTIIGKWAFDKITMSVETDDPEIEALMNEYIDYYIAETNDEMQGMTYEFKEDGTCTIYYPAFDDEEEYEYTTTYSVDGDKLTMEDETITIKTLNKNQLIFEEVEEDEEDGISYKLTMTVEFKRA